MNEAKTCFVCDKPSVDVDPADLFFTCENKKHRHRAKEKTLYELAVIRIIGFKKWLNKKPRLIKRGI